MSNTARPGDVVAGHVLLTDGTWMPLASIQQPPQQPPRPPLAEQNRSHLPLPIAIVSTLALIVIWCAVVFGHGYAPWFQWSVCFAAPAFAVVLIVCAVVKRRLGESTAHLVMRRVLWSALGYVGLAVFFMVFWIYIIHEEGAKRVAAGLAEPFDPTASAPNTPQKIVPVDQYGSPVGGGAMPYGAQKVTVVDQYGGNIFTRN